MTGGRGLGVACGHINASGLFPFSHQRKICAEDLQGRHALSMLWRTLLGRTKMVIYSRYTHLRGIDAHKVQGLRMLV